MKTLLKDTLREVKNSFSRFISILLIVGLGVGFFSGLKATAPDMKLTGDSYFDEYNLMDFWLISTMGFEEKDREELSKISEIERVTAGYSMDVLTEIDEKDTVMKVMSLSQGYKSGLNIPVLVEGRLPEENGECVLEARPDYMEKFEIGSKIRLKSGKEEPLTDDLKNEDYTVVGFVNSPLYITQERGSSSIGNGKVASYIIIPEEEFKSEYFTEIYLGIDPEIDSFSKEYKDKLDTIKKDIEDLGEVRRKARLEDIQNELNEKLVDGRKELEEEKIKGEDELKEALTEIEDGKNKLLNAKRELDNGKRKISTGEKELIKGEATLKKEIEDAILKIDEEEIKLNLGIKEYEEGLKKFNEEKIVAEEKLKESEKIINENEAKLIEGENGLKELEKTIADLKLQLDKIEEPEQKAVIEKQIQELEPKYEATKQELEKARVELEAGKKELEAGKQELLKAENTLKATKEQLDNGQKQIIAGREKIEKERINGENQLSIEKNKLEKAKRDIRDGELKLIDSEKELEDGEKEYKEGLETFNKEIENAERDLKKLEREIKKIEEPDWYIVKRNDTRDYNEFEMGADRIDSVAKVFPLFFLLIALLVVLTTMTRMVDEQRGYIGILKAMGYNNFAIMTKYLLYGVIASLAGSIVGLLLGFKILPTVIFNAYRMMFIMPPVIIEFNTFYALTTTLAAVLTTLIAVFIAVKSELTEVPAMLMRPKAPRAGQRIFLERIKPIWKNLSFSKKVTARNVFRYKRRLFMTIIGIAGCTALLLAGYGLRDSIMDISVNQFDKISKYQMTVDINDGIIYKDKDPVIKFLNNDERIDSFILGHNKLIEAKKGDVEENLEIMVVEDNTDLNDFINLKNRITNEKLELDNESVIVTEKMAELLDLSVGENIKLTIDDKDYEFKIKGITENYAFHYVYMTESYYEKIVNEEMDYNKIYVKTTDTDKEFEDNLSKDLLEVDDVSSLSFITGISKNLNETMDSLDTVIIVVIAAAGALAFIVLYNLTNINVSERMKELATIKVLGFYDNEVSKYVYRENNILTALGIMVGLVMGIFLHKFIIQTVEINMIMFGRRIKLLSYVYAAILTMVFSLLVNVVVHYKLKKIDMVESMKSVD